MYVERQMQMMLQSQKNPIVAYINAILQMIHLVLYIIFSHRCTVLLCSAIFMATLLVTPGAAVTVKVFKSKDEGLAYCNNIQGSKSGHYSVYPGTQGGNDVFYSCAYEKEETSKFKAGAPCKTKNYVQREEAPAPNAYYQCLKGHWQIGSCFYTGSMLQCNTKNDDE